MKRSIIAALVAIAFAIVLVSVAVEAPTGVRQDPLPAFNFRVEIDGITAGSFRSVSGLSCETEVIEYRSGDDNTIRLLPGRTRCGPIVLTNGLTQSRELWNWYQEVITGNLVRKNGAVVIMDYNKVERARYNFFEAWPSAYEISPLDAGQKDIVIESLTLVVEGIVRG